MVVIAADALLVVFNGDVPRRCESNRFNVSLVTVLVLVGVVAVDDVRHGVFITSRRICGMGVAFALFETGFASTIEGVASVLVGGVVAAVTFNPPFATSSITSSMCERAGVVDGCFSPFKFDEETMFETKAIKSVGAGRDGWLVGLGNDATKE